MFRLAKFPSIEHISLRICGKYRLVVEKFKNLISLRCRKILDKIKLVHIEYVNYKTTNMLTHSMIPCYKRQIRLCRFLGFKSYKFSKKDETLVELIQFKRYSWSTLLLAIVTLFGFFVPFNGLYVIYRVSTAEMMGDKFGITSLVIIAMTSIAMFADVTALRKSITIFCNKNLLLKPLENLN